MIGVAFIYITRFSKFLLKFFSFIWVKYLSYASYDSYTGLLWKKPESQQEEAPSEKP